VEHLLYIRIVLLLFEAVSSLKVNLGTSEIVPIGEVEDISILINIVTKLKLLMGVVCGRT
jgi:hypothetical protein